MDVPHGAELAKEIEELLGSDVEAAGDVSAWRRETWALTDLRFLTKRALQGKTGLAEVV